MIPLVDLKRQFTYLKSEILPKIEEVIDSTDYIQGKYVDEFEKLFSQLQQVPHVVGCSNGTSAISLVLEAIGIKTGDEVITTPNTFFATVEAICHVGAKPVFVDIDPDTYNLDITKIDKAITSRTKAILPVHIYGHPVDMPELIKIANKHSLYVIEDCAQAHLACVAGQPVGSFGIAGTFSFYPGKNLGAYGDAGAIVSTQPEIIEKCRHLLDHGRREKYSHDYVGYNFRMDCLQAAVLSVKSKYLSQWTTQRQHNAEIYDHYFAKNPHIKTPYRSPNARHVFHLYVIQVDNRDAVASRLKENQISTGIHYPIPMHLQPALSFLGYKRGSFPVVEDICQKIISLPMFPELSEIDIKSICDKVNEVSS